VESLVGESLLFVSACAGELVTAKLPVKTNAEIKSKTNDFVICCLILIQPLAGKKGLEDDY
jgi:hypothetical protein